MNIYEKNPQYNSYVQILEPGKEARDRAGYAYGADFACLTKDQLQALLDGKQLQIDINEGEYVLFIAYKEAYKE